MDVSICASNGACVDIERTVHEPNGGEKRGKANSGNQEGE
jgi:hypothetical protein